MNKCPDSEIEKVEFCPFCGSNHRETAYTDVEDWSFYSAPGKWDYWECKKCNSLYLDARPNQRSIGMAYQNYYTHEKYNQKIFTSFKKIIHNELNSNRLNINLRPRLHIPNFLKFALEPLHKRLPMSFMLNGLRDMKTKGVIMDVGCGSGEMLNIAHHLGWKAYGIESDPEAVKNARNKGLNIEHASYHALSKYKDYFDCILCSHVLEHVHSPLEMLDAIHSSLKVGGVLFLSLPNSKSAMREYFGANWRGLEAPRHLAIPSSIFLKRYLEKLNFDVKQNISNVYPTILDSLRIQRRSVGVKKKDIQEAKSIAKKYQSVNSENVDFIEFICKKII
jgi:2-polyprenyl-3-methyl-5-hydroxy-6-metoxy-1,4-benzoquinol methylase